MTNEEYRVKHFLIHDTLNNIDPTEEKFEELSSLFEELDSNKKVLISREIIREIIILFKCRGIKANTFKKIIRDFDNELIMYDIFGDKVFEKQTNPNPPVSFIGVK